MEAAQPGHLLMAMLQHQPTALFPCVQGRDLTRFWNAAGHGRGHANWEGPMPYLEEAALLQFYRRGSLSQGAVLTRWRTLSPLPTASQMHGRLWSAL
jgi:hypothetical protein